MPNRAKMSLTLPSTMAQSQVPQPARDLVARLYSQAQATGARDPDVLWKAVLEHPILSEAAGRNVPAGVAAVRGQARMWASAKAGEAARWRVGELQREKDAKEQELKNKVQEQNVEAAVNDVLSKYEGEVGGGAMGLIRKTNDMRLGAFRRVMVAKARNLVQTTVSPHEIRAEMSRVAEEYWDERKTGRTAKERTAKATSDEKLGKEANAFIALANSLSPEEFAKHRPRLDALKSAVESGAFTSERAWSEVRELIKPPTEKADGTRVPNRETREGNSKWFDAMRKIKGDGERLKANGLNERGQKELARQVEELMQSAPTIAEIEAEMKATTDDGKPVLNPTELAQRKWLIDQLKQNRDAP